MSNLDLKALIGLLNPVCKRNLEVAASLCVNRKHYEVTLEHLLLVLLEDQSADLLQAVLYFGRDPERLKGGLQRSLEKMKRGNTGRPVFSPFLMSWISRAWMITSVDFRTTEVRSGFLLLALLENPGRYVTGDYIDFLDSLSKEELRLHFHDILRGSSESPKISRRAGGLEEGTEGELQTQDWSGEGSALGLYTQNFTQRAREEQIDPVFGRDREIRQMIDILARRRKNNPIIVGEAGVGKTALAEGLALRIAEEDVPELLLEVEIICLDLGLLQAGAGIKGEFEARLKQVIDEVKASPKPIVLFIDEAHTLIGAGGSEGGSDAANLLKPALARGELRTIAATTWSEYKKYFEKDAALSRRFQLVKLEEPNIEETVVMLRGLRSRFEVAHQVIIRDDALVAAAELGSRYISGRLQPDKGVDLIDTGGARVKVALSAKPALLEECERLIQTHDRELEVLRRDLESCASPVEGRIAELEDLIAEADRERSRLQKLWEREQEAAQAVIKAREALWAYKEAEESPDLEQLEKLQGKVRVLLRHLKELQGKEGLVSVEVTPEIIAQVVSDWTGIPLGRMVKDQARALLDFEERLGERIKGQEQVLQMVGEGIRAAKAGLKDPKTPLGVFLFVGPSGVGKTETGLGVADLLFGGDRFLTTVNMSEFQEKHTVSRLIGSPPGYVGYGQGGVLTEAVRQRPYSVVLLDEAEKANSEVLNLFYQVFDKGTLADGEGRVIDFKNTVIFLTVNLGSELIMKQCARGRRPPAESLIKKIRPILSAHFKPALLARMNIVPFLPISPGVMQSITRLKLGHLADRLMESHKMKLGLDPKVVRAIADRCTEVETGARNVDHIIAGSLLPQISTAILEQMAIGPLPEYLDIGLDERGGFCFHFGEEAREFEEGGEDLEEVEAPRASSDDAPSSVLGDDDPVL